MKFGGKDTVTESCGEMEAPIVLTPEDLAAGKRPKGYQGTTEALREAHTHGRRVRTVLGLKFQGRWMALQAKGRESGLTQSECDELAAMSCQINELL